MASGNVVSRTYENASLAQAIVAHEPGPDHKHGSNWKLQDVHVPTELRQGEVLIEMVATGICHTDLTFTGPAVNQTFPIVAGHEGSGYVRAIGPSVTKAIEVGDPVLMSFTRCTACAACQTQRPAYCDSFVPMNLYGEAHVLQDPQSSSPIIGKYFGQSSFAKLSIVSETCLVPVKGLVKNREELQLFSPLGCGIQTGVGAVLNLVKAGPQDRVMVCGLGGVGLSAVMGARIAGCKEIIAVDRVQARIDIAQQVFGATHGLNTASADDLPAAMKAFGNGRGPTVIVETTGVPSIVEAAYSSLDAKGTHVQIAGAAGTYKFSIDLTAHIFRGIRLLGCVEGDGIPEVFVPEMIGYYREGRLPLDQMVKYYDALDFEKALQDMHSGAAIKPVLLW